jgi:hypothetical protein
MSVVISQVHLVIGMSHRVRRIEETLEARRIIVHMLNRLAICCPRLRKVEPQSVHRRILTERRMFLMLLGEALLESFPHLVAAVRMLRLGRVDG